MEKFNIQIVIAFLGTIASALFGELILVFRVLVGLIIIDFIVGSLKAIYLNNLSSREMWKGIIRKVCTLITVIVANLLDKLMGYDLLKTAICWFFCASESISITENLALMGIVFPKFWMDALVQIKTDDLMEKDKPRY